MSSRFLAIAALCVALLVAACDGGGSMQQASTVTPAAVSPTAELKATVVPVPDEPSALADFGDVIAAYLSASPAAAETCLAALFDAWNMKLIDRSVACRRGNSDGDADEEIVVALSGAQPEPGAASEFNIAVFDPAGASWRVSFTSRGEDWPTEVVSASVVLGGAERAFAYKTTVCGAHTCNDRIHVVAGDGQRRVTPEDGFAMNAATFAFRDREGDGVDELFAHGGAIGSVGAGPNRLYTDRYVYDGAMYVLESSVKDAPAYLYHAILDADALLGAGKYADAETAYTTAIADSALQDAFDRNAELKAYALYRSAVAVLARGGDGAAAEVYAQRAVDEFGATLHARLAGAFLDAYRAKASIELGCAAVNRVLEENADAFAALWDFGYGNPPFDAAQVCPF